MSKLKKIAGVNILIIFAYSILPPIFLNNTTNGEDSIGGVFLLIYAVGLQVIINLIISICYFVNSNKEFGKLYLLIAGIVLLVGFSACWCNIAHTGIF
jgi:hypothetical protein